MKRLAATVAIGSLAALAPAAQAADPPKDMVRGLGLVGSTSLNHFAFAAHSGPLGEDAHGNVHVFDNTTADGNARRRFQGEVTCLRVSGNLATFVVDFRKLVNRPSFDGALFVVEDNGNPPSAESPDRIGIRDFVGDPPPCPDPLTVRPPQGFLIRGDIEVRDATA